MYSKIVSVIVLLSIFCWCANAQAASENCQPENGYCQNHWDCCSGSCLSFSYKCVRSAAPAMTNPAGAPGSSQSAVDLGNRFGPGQAVGSSSTTGCALGGQYCQSHGDCCSQSCMSFSYKCLGDTIAAGPQYPLFISSGGLQQSGTVDLGNRFGSNSFQPSPIFGETQPSIVNSIDDLISSLNFNQGSNPPNTQTQTRFGGETATPTKKNCLGIESRCKNVQDCCSLNCLYNVCMAGYNQTNGAEHSNQPCLEVGEKCFRHDECCSGRCHGYLHQCVT